MKPHLSCQDRATFKILQRHIQYGLLVGGTRIYLHFNKEGREIGNRVHSAVRFLFIDERNKKGKTIKSVRTRSP